VTEKTIFLLTFYDIFSSWSLSALTKAHFTNFAF